MEEILWTVFSKKHLNYYKEVVDEINLQNRNNMLLGSKCVNKYLEWERNNLMWQKKIYIFQISKHFPWI